ncbi:unnamed protein product [Rhizophagus irregularis]|uniref:Uncharacterized protein n=1 Tax=Rhizophagus irregularis TaxID=588596 RepID=A0A915YSD2_9GLOM|nr:unnamed protein product [Rhizophagus irregularis]CAB5327654.1 unnamed protein product [Rhizophagus irregularis]
MAVQPINHAVNNNQYRILIEAGADINPAYPKSTCLPLPIHDYKCPRTIIESAIILNEGNIKSYEEKLNGEKEKEPVSNEDEVTINSLSELLEKEKKPKKSVKELQEQLNFVRTFLEEQVGTLEAEKKEHHLKEEIQAINKQQEEIYKSYNE